jgi:hypothetical protein
MIKEKILVMYVGRNDNVCFAKIKQIFVFVCLSYYSLAVVPGIARDEKLRKQIFEITWRDKGWIG